MVKALSLRASQPSIKEGRYFFNETPKPAYTPFTYPHPLTGPAQPRNLQIPGPWQQCDCKVVARELRYSQL
jgi:hypothetical protein